MVKIDKYKGLSEILKIFIKVVIKMNKFIYEHKKSWSNKPGLITLLIFAALLIANNSSSQIEYLLKDSLPVDTIQNNLLITDTIKGNFSELLERMAKEGLENSEANYIKNQLIQQQIKSFNRIGDEIQNTNTILKQGIDYAEFTRELNSVIEYKKVAVIGILVNANKYLTLRNLTTTSILLNEIFNRTETQLKKIKQDNLMLTDAQHRLDSLVSNINIYVVPEDSSSKIIYYQRFVAMNKELELLEVKLKNAIDSIQRLEILSNEFKYDLQSDIAEINKLEQAKYDRFFVSKYKIFTERNPEKITFLDSVFYSFERGLLLLVFYFYNHWSKLLIIPLLILAISVYLRVLRGKYKKSGIYNEFKFPIQIFRHPIATATLISITIYQFFLPLPPFALTGVLWFLSGIALTIIFHKTENKYVYITWMAFFILNLFALFDHLILIHTIPESWLILILTLAAIGFGIYTIVHRKKFYNPTKIWIIFGMLILEVIAVIFLLMGNYNTGKIFFSEGLYTILVGYLLINTFRLSRNIFSFSEYLKESDEEKKPDTLKNTTGKISIPSFTFFLLGWFVLLTRNSYIFQKSVEPLKDILSKTREIGQFEFTYEGIFTFFIVLFLSGFISKIVSFLADDKRVKNSGSKSSGLGSWLLLIRIGIITAGIIIAFRSAGFPMDKLTIILSALGVGIGFGLQTLVNNLVSGLIIAFEKPINLEDIVEIGGQTGKMKSIGIRSSVLSTWDGADVIIPNGDLLNQHLVNWTLGSNRRRFEIKVGVAYGTDLEKVKMLIENILAKNKQVLKNPPPSILFVKFNDSSIDVSIKFWIVHFIYGYEIQSKLILEIDAVFKDNGIVIPFPQRDIHIKSEKLSENQKNELKE